MSIFQSRGKTSKALIVLALVFLIGAGDDCNDDAIRFWHNITLGLVPDVSNQNYNRPEMPFTPPTTTPPTSTQPIESVLPDLGKTTPGTTPKEGPKLMVIQHGQAFIPVSELEVRSGPDCENNKAPHWHSVNGPDSLVKAFNNDGKMLTIVDPGSCAFGKTSEVQPFEKPVTPETMAAFTKKS